jgi:DNA-directed RNA polymerase subunit RPC12/RpoP
MATDFHTLLTAMNNLRKAAKEVLYLAQEDESRAEAWKEELDTLETTEQEAWDQLLAAGWTWKNANEEERVYTCAGCGKEVAEKNAIWTDDDLNIVCSDECNEDYISNKGN